MLKKKMIFVMIMVVLASMGTTAWGIYNPNAKKDYESVGLEGRFAKFRYKPGEIVVKFKQGVPRHSVDTLARGKGASIKRKLRLRDSNVYLLTMPEGANEKKIIRGLKRNPNVVYIERNVYLYALSQLTPNDPNYAQQYALNNTGQSYPVPSGGSESGTSDADIDAPEGWYDLNDVFGRIGDPNIVIAIVDTGVDVNHTDLADSIGTGDFAGYDFVNDDNDPMDDDGHGTHCAGIAAAVTDNNICVAGVAAGCTIMPIKVLDANGVGSSAQIAEGIDYASDPNHQADVISLSLGGPFPSKLIKDAVVNAYNGGCVVVAAAGNSGVDLATAAGYPALYTDVIAVSATDSNDNLASFSSYGVDIDVAAPGVNILSLHAAGTDSYGDANHYYPDGDANAAMYILSGTSMACPHVAGLAALCLSVDPNLTQDEIRWFMRNSSDDLGDKGFDRLYGYGRINVYEAVYGISNVPSKATAPFPADDSNNLSVNVDLMWKPASGALSHDVYFGTGFNDVNDANTSSDEFVVNQLEAIFDQNTLDPNTTYYWRIDEKNNKGTTKGDVWSFATGSGSGIFYVDTDADPNGDGSSWSEAFDDLQDALDSASWSGDQIWTAEGTYKPTTNNPGISFEPEKGVELYGGFVGTETARSQRDWTLYKTILSGDINVPGDANDNCYIVVFAADDIILDGLTIKGGYARGSAPYDMGGGMLNYSADSTIRNCIFQDNKGLDAGGMYNVLSSPKIMNSNFIANEAVRPGVNPIGFGGGILNYLCSEVTVTNCVFNGNKSNYDGGGLANLASSLSLTNCTFEGNSAEEGGAVYQWIGADQTMTNCILWGNDANSIGDEIYNDGFYSSEFGDCNLVISYSDIENCYDVNGVWDANLGTDGGGNIDSDPCFVDTYHLSLDSLCVNAGDPNGDYTGQVDIDGDSRVFGGKVDIGADEVWRVHNITQDKKYFYIQDAIDGSNNNDIIEVYPDTYIENVQISSKSCTLRGTDPNDWATVANTIIDANAGTYAVKFVSSTDSNLAGLTLRNAQQGILCTSSSDPTIKNCIMEDNSSNGIYGVGTTPTIINNKIRNNGGNGIAVFGSSAQDIKNNLIYGNNRGIYMAVASSSKIIRNNTIVDNDTAGISVVSGTSPTISNCIIWDCNDDLYGCSATYSCIEDANSGTGNISSDPCFLSVDANDPWLYHLEPDSNCIDTGDPNSTHTGEFDIDFEGRVDNNDVDMGADEYINLVGCADFSCTTGWTITDANYWSISGGKAVFSVDEEDNTDADLYQSIDVQIGKKYYIKFKILDWQEYYTIEAGGMLVYLGTSPSLQEIAILDGTDGAGTYTYIITATQGGRITFNAGSGAEMAELDIELDDVSVTEIPAP